MTDASLRLSYLGDIAGPGVSAHDVGNALLAVDGLTKSYLAVVAPRARAGISCHGVKLGSLHLYLEVVRTVVDATNVGKLDVDTVRDAGDAGAAAYRGVRDAATSKDGQFLAMVAGGLWWTYELTRRFKGKPLEDDSLRVHADGTVRVQLEDGSTLQLPLHVVETYRSHRAREAMLNIVAPIVDCGFEAGEIVHGSRATRISSGEAPAIVANLSVEPPAEREWTLENQPLTVVQPAFESDYVWRFDNGFGKLTARIGDTLFMDRVLSKAESFAAGDVLVCDVRVKSRRTRAGKERRTHEVIRARRGDRQAPTLQLPLDESAATNLAVLA